MASTVLKRTLSTPTSAYIGTVSHWIKRSGLSSTNMGTFAAWDDGGVSTNRAYLNLFNDDIYFYDQSNSMVLQTDRKFRDTSAWYHIVIAWDTTQATASNRVKIYVNGVQETSFSTETYPAQNSTLEFNTSGRTFGVGSLAISSVAAAFFDGSMAHFHFIDGTAYDADTFGETDSTTGIWKPKVSPSVTYGTNGFFLKFENSGAFGTDSSGNSNTLTVNGTMTQTIDTPSNVFATWNPLNTYPSNKPVLSNGNTTVVTVNADPGYWGASSTIGVSQGKWYWEVKQSASSGGNAALFGVSYNPAEMARNGATFNSQVSSAEYMYYSFNGNKYHNTTSSSYGNSYTTNDIIGIALDLDNNYIYFAKNGTWQNSGDPTSGASGTGAAFNITSGQTYFPVCSDGGGIVPTFQANFGNGYFGTTAVSSAQNPDDGIGIFEYDVPTGYRALCTKSINAEEYS